MSSKKGSERNVIRAVGLKSHEGKSLSTFLNQAPIRHSWVSCDVIRLRIPFQEA
jgi:hypothetical protein